MKYQTVLLDADETLLDFSRSEKEAVSDAMTANGILPTEEAVHRYSEINLSLWKRVERGEIKKEFLMGHRFELLVREFGYEVAPAKLAEAYVCALSQKGYVLEGAEAFLERLSRVAELYIVTNGIKSIQASRYEKSGLQPWIRRVFVSADMGYDKPDARYFEMVAKEIPNFDKKRTVIVGDSLTSDMKGGLQFGIDTCWFNPKGKEKPEEMDLTFVASNYDEIYHFITTEKA